MDWLGLYLLIGFVVSTITYRIDQIECTQVEHPSVMLIGIVAWPVFYAMILYGILSDWNEYKNSTEE